MSFAILGLLKDAPSVSFWDKCSALVFSPSPTAYLTKYLDYIGSLPSISRKEFLRLRNIHGQSPTPELDDRVFKIALRVLAIKRPTETAAEYDQRVVKISGSISPREVRNLFLYFLDGFSPQEITQEAVVVVNALFNEINLKDENLISYIKQLSLDKKRDLLEIAKICLNLEEPLEARVNQIFDKFITSESFFWLETWKRFSFVFEKKEMPVWVSRAFSAFHSLVSNEASVISAIQLCTDDLEDPQSKFAIAEFVIAHSHDKMQEIAKILPSLKAASQGANERILLLYALFAVDESALKELDQDLAPLLSDAVQDYGVCELVSVFVQIEPTQRRGIALEFSQFLKDHPSLSHLLYLLPEVANLGIQERNLHLEEVASFHETISEMDNFSRLPVKVQNQIQEEPLLQALERDITSSVNQSELIAFIGLNVLTNKANFMAFLKKISDTEDQLTLLQKIAAMSFKGQRVVWDLALPLLEDSRPYEEVHKLIEHASLVPFDERFDCLSKAQALKSPSSSFHEIEGFFALFQFSREERDRVFDLAKPFLQSLSSAAEKVQFVSMLFKHSAEFKERLLRFTPLLVQWARGLCLAQDCMRLLDSAIEEICDKDELSSIDFEDASLLIDEDASLGRRFEVLEFLRYENTHLRCTGFSENERKLIKELLKGNDIIARLDAMQKLEVLLYLGVNISADFVSQENGEIFPVRGGYRYLYISGDEISFKNHFETQLRLLSFLVKLKREFSLKEIVGFFRHFSSVKECDLFKTIAFSMRLSELSRGKIMAICRSLLESNRENLIQKFGEFLEENSSTDMLEVFERMVTATSVNNLDFLSLLETQSLSRQRAFLYKPLLQGHAQSFSLKDAFEIAQSVSAVRPHMRRHSIQKTQDFLRGTDNWNAHNIRVFLTVFDAVGSFPHYDTIFEVLKAEGVDIQHLSIRQAVFTYIKTILIASPTTSVLHRNISSYFILSLLGTSEFADAREQARFVMDNFAAFGWNPDDQVVILATSVLTWGENDSKSPYNIFKRHQSNAENSAYTEFLAYVFHDYYLSFSAKPFVAIAKQKGGSLSIPSDVGATFLESLFNEISLRINELGEEAKAKTLQDIQASTRLTFNGLRNNWLNSPLIQALLSSFDDLDARPSITAFKFAWILKYIKDQSPIIAPNKLLSPREEVLFAMSASIQNCPTGKEEGIAIAFNLLPEGYKGKKSDAAMPDIERAKEYIFDFYQKELASFLSNDTAFLRSLVDVAANGQIAQLSHQCLYVKNAIGARLGLIHEVKFDFYTGVLANKLVRLPVSDIKELFFKHFSLDVFFSNLRAKINADLRNIPNLYSTLNSFLESAQTQAGSNGKKMSFNLSEIWEVNENNRPCITSEGVIYLLQALGVLENTRIRYQPPQEESSYEPDGFSATCYG